MTQLTKDRVKDWLIAAGVRALKTWAQAGIAYFGSGAVGVLETDWIGFWSITLMSAVLSILTSISGLPEVSDGEHLFAIVSGDHVREE